jgi:hypothetical protein
MTPYICELSILEKMRKRRDIMPTPYGWRYDPFLAYRRKRSLPLLRSMCKNTPSPMPRDLNMFRFMISFASCFMMGKACSMIYACLVS